MPIYHQMFFFVKYIDCLECQTNAVFDVSPLGKASFLNLSDIICSLCQFVWHNFLDDFKFEICYSNRPIMVYRICIVSFRNKNNIVRIKILQNLSRSKTCKITFITSYLMMFQKVRQNIAPNPSGFGALFI